MAKTVEVWNGKGVLWHGRKKIKAGEEIPASLNADVRKSLKAKGHIKEVVADESNTTLGAAIGAEAKAEKLEAALAAAKKAEADAKQFDIGKLTKAVQTAKGVRTKAQTAAEADKDNTELAAKAAEADVAVKNAEANLTDANAVAETAVRLRLDADVLANG